jgi:protein-S-isoprenylcysteine O-methyltransferase Ste14
MQKLIVAIPTPIWSLILLVAAYIAGEATGLSTPLFRQPILGIVLIAEGVAISAWAALTFRRAGTEIRPASASNKALVTHGPFGFSRNPMYAGNFVVVLGIAVLAGPPLLYVAALVVLALDHFVIIPFEETKMERQYADAFREYKSKVRRWI